MSGAVSERDNLPEGWIKIRLGDHLELKYGKGISKKDRKPGTIPIYGSSGIIGYHNFALVKDCSIVVGRKGSAGNVQFVDRSCWPIDTTYFINETNIYILKFLYYLLVYLRLQNLDSSTAIPSLRRVDAYNIKIPLPPLNEQKRIVSKIESIFAQIDGARTRLEVASGMLNKLRSSVLRQAFEGKLVPQDPNDTPVEAILKRIRRASEKELVFERDNLPNGWILVKIDYICKLIGGGTPSRKNLDYFNGDIVWLTPTEISKNSIQKIYDSKEKITKLGLEKSSARVIPINSVLLTTRASIGYVAIAGIDTSTNQGFASFSCNGTMFNYYLAYWLWSKKNFLESEATGTTFKEISKSKLREIQIPLPPLAEQKRIVSKIESIFTRIDVVERYIESTLRLLDLLKSSTLKQAFEGRLVPQDPDDEPAEFLLQIMKQEKQLIKSQKSSYGRKNVR